MKKPNFFIIGAPKCGTTAMYNWLKQYTTIFFPDIKELHFFSTDLKESKRLIKDIDTYLSLFQSANENHKIIGEASVFYLFSDTAVQNILEFNKNAKFLVMLRNPIDMVASLHAQYLFTGNEIYYDFEKAWMLQNERINGIGVTKITEDPQLLQYGKVCKVGEQIKKVLSKIDNKNILFLFLEDFLLNAETELKKVTSFLEIPYEQVEFKTYNQAKSRKFNLAYRVFKYLVYYKEKAGIGKINSGFGRLVTKLTTKEGGKSLLNPVIRNELIDYFEQDIRLLMKLLNRDLSHWLKKEHS